MFWHEKFGNLNDRQLNDLLNFAFNTLIIIDNFSNLDYDGIYSDEYYYNEYARDELLKLVELRDDMVNEEG